ncbi:hypothetical protein Bca52824_058126 [Brassica carinata]|uniref:Ubiquitin-like protease family profile domain-containing protein n=1 Tax=Brassica carinata TaxID=52824 RepID=A0A8X7UGV2_BRACI|nr:hypothetical protein Bca52824_058126 [Brassica carinata]
MDEWRRIVLIASQQIFRPTVVRSDLWAMLMLPRIPLGRESLICLFKAQTRNIPMLLSKIPAPLNDQTIMELTEPNLPNHPSIELDAVLQLLWPIVFLSFVTTLTLCVTSHAFAVTPLIPVIRGPHTGWGVWPKDKTDDKLCGPEEIAFGACFHVYSNTGKTRQQETHCSRKGRSLRQTSQSGKETSVLQIKGVAHASRPPHQLRPSSELLEARISTLEANATVMAARITGLEATVAKLGASNEVSDGILGSGSSILSQYRAQHCASRRIDFKTTLYRPPIAGPPSHDHKSSPHHFPPTLSLSHSHNQRSTPFLATDHNSSYHQINPHQSPDHQSPNHQTHNHPSRWRFSEFLDHATAHPRSSYHHNIDPPALTITLLRLAFSPKFSNHENIYRTISPFHRDPTNEHGVGEASDSSPDKTVRRVVDELNVLFLTIALLTLEIDAPILILAPLILQAQTSVPEVCELSDSSPARKTKDHHPFHVTPSKLDFSNQFLLQLATPPKDVTLRHHMAVLMHILDMHHKDVLLMENATFMPPTLTSLMQSKDRQFQAAVKKDKIRWDHRVSKLILLPAIDRVDTPTHSDSLPSLYDEEDVQRFLRPILQMLPYLIRYLVKNNSRDLSPFTCQRRTGTYENTSPGDHRVPVMLKFMELHLFVRQQYAMEAYKTIVLPAYY